ncbi:PREDICTED: vascular endothelial growth factor C-like, partial [Tauraco erythrolophus]|uniref:vascular endothelial growth factor C-like n=1 Tax=Tauraco erythrolophus TaxID=121530 RepID=UPI0005232242
MDVRSASLPCPHVPHMFPSGGRKASVPLAFSALVQPPASRYSRGTCCCGLRRQPGRNEATQALLLPSLERDESKQIVAELGVYSAWISVCDPRIENQGSILLAVLGPGQKFCSNLYRVCSQLPATFCSVPRDISCLTLPSKGHAHASKDLEEQLRSVSSVDELMTVLYPEYWKMFKCQLRKGGWQHNREHSSFDTRSDDSLKFAAAHYNAEILKSIDTEWRKTQCMPREVCVDVGKEFGATTNTFFKPPCVSIYRCGGCCNSEGLQCMNISTNYISKT